MATRPSNIVRGEMRLRSREVPTNVFWGARPRTNNNNIITSTSDQLDPSDQNIEDSEIQEDMQKSILPAVLSPLNGELTVNQREDDGEKVGDELNGSSRDTSPNGENVSETKKREQKKMNEKEDDEIGEEVAMLGGNEEKEDGNEGKEDEDEDGKMDENDRSEVEKYDKEEEEKDIDKTEVSNDMEELESEVESESSKKYTDEDSQDVPSTSVGPLSIVIMDESTNSAPTSGSSQTKTKRKKVVDDNDKKKMSLRRNPNGDNIFSNFTQSTVCHVPRNICYPTGLKRVPFHFPIKKCNSKLAIAMASDKRRDPDENGEEMDTVVQKIRTGAEYQVNPETLIMSSDSSPMDCEDRDECVWRPPNDDTLYDIDGINTTREAIIRQFERQIPDDAFLHRLMKCDYDIDKTLETIEHERLLLPQPFRPLSTAQQLEFEKDTMKPKHRGNQAMLKNFRLIQEKYMRSYHYGEIVKYYYDLKSYTCTSNNTNMCKCRQNKYTEAPLISTIECSNCTKNVRPRAAESDKLCDICDLYFKRNGKHREPSGIFVENDEMILKKWIEMEEEKGVRLTVEEVKKQMTNENIERWKTLNMTEEELDIVGSIKRRDKNVLVRDLLPFEPTYISSCYLAPKSEMKEDENQSINKFDVKEYSGPEKKTIIKAYEKHGIDHEKVAIQVGLQKEEIVKFFKRYNNNYHIEDLYSKFKDPNEIVGRITRGAARGASNGNTSDSSISDIEATRKRGKKREAPTPIASFGSIQSSMKRRSIVG